ncbi:ABC transporter, transmembrane domain, type 1 [Akanthomyces lecanii RCEF 1005]|uniref:ABC transporter, transmembrane domain, type 1 n=1 Tax=Akanthomyces lecanii RCEF 1005 TaxID=1081108 RepID=A0A168HD54_CORDF|nr:ABC transporter, transmembrane domain, type 1 [Akanthomyces lecanii RCEF 1005]
MRAGLDWLLLGVLPRWAKTEINLRGIMISHGVSLVIRPLYRDGRSKSSRDSLIVTATAIVASWAVVIGSGSSGASAGRLLPWIIVTSHVFNVYYESKAAKPSRSVINGAVSAAILLVLESIHYSQELEVAGNTWLSVFSISKSALLLVFCLFVPRGNDESYKGLPADRQHTGSVIELLTFLWPRKTFRLDSLQRKNAASLPALPAGLRTAALTERHQRLASQRAAHKLSSVLLRDYFGPLALQSILAILSSLAVLGPNLVTYRLLQHLSGEREGDNRDTIFLVALLGASSLLPVILTAWMRWLGSSMIAIPMRYTLSALTYQKVLSLPTIPVSPEDREAKSIAILLYMNALSARACSAFPICYKVVGLLTQLVSTTAVLVTLVGWKSVAIAIAAALSITPLTTIFMKRWSALLVGIWKLMSNRSAILKDALLAIRQIKLSAAEPAWKQKIYRIREKEVKGYKDIAWLMFWMVIVGNISPAVLSGVPMYIYAWQGQLLTTSVAFTFINLFKELQSKLWAVPQELPRIKAAGTVQPNWMLF